MNWSKVGKVVVRALTQSSVSQVVMNAVEFTTPATAHPASKLLSKLGGFIISSMISDHAVVYVMGELESVVNNNKEGA